MVSPSTVAGLPRTNLTYLYTKDHLAHGFS
jgi:hypothetical protein